MRKFTKIMFSCLITVITVMPLRSQETPAYALKNVTIHHSDGTQTEGATIVWRNGIIQESGADISVPFDAFTIDGGDSLHVYPGFMDGLSIMGSPEMKDDLPPLENPGDPPYDRAGIQPERRPYHHLKKDKGYKSAMEHGFTTVASGLEGNMLPGQVEVFALSPDMINDGLIMPSIGLQGSFRTAPGGWRSGAYPSTQMGVMAMFRQTMYDADALQTHMNYHASNPEMPAPNRSDVLESMFPLLNNTKPLYFEADTEVDIELMYRYQDEFGFDIVLVSGKEAWKEKDELKNRNIPVLLSFDLDEAPEWYKEEKKAESDSTSEEKEITQEEQNFRDAQLKAWKEHVTNARMLIDAGVSVGFASVGMDHKDLGGHIKVLLDEGGLTEQELLSLMTTQTAIITGADAYFGNLKAGKMASFSVTDGPVFEEKTKLTHSISNGVIYEF